MRGDVDVFATARGDGDARPRSTVPYAPGGGTCDDAQCGGPRYCLHRHVDAALYEAPARAALHAWRMYALAESPPYALTAPEGARRALAALHAAQARARDLARCGASAEVMALLEETLASLVRRESLPLDELLRDLALDWRRLQTLDFTPALLRQRTHVPLLPLLRAPVHLSGVQLAEYSLSYEYLHAELELSLTELAALRYTGAQLYHLGMRGNALAAALQDETPPGATLAQHAATLVHCLRLTPALVARLMQEGGLFAGRGPLPLRDAWAALSRAARAHA